MISAIVFCGLEENSTRAGIISLDNIMSCVCESLDITVEKAKLFYSSRKKEHVFARHLYAYFSRKYTRETLESIAFVIGKDHGTIIHSDRQISDWIETDKVVKATCRKIDIRIKSELKRIETNIDEEIINNIIKKYKNA